MEAVSLRCWAPVVVVLIGSLFLGSEARADDSADAQRLLEEAIDARSRDDLSEARRLLARSLELAPAAPIAFNLADVLSRMGRACEAAELYSSLLEGTFGELGNRRTQVEERRAESVAQSAEIRFVLEGAPSARLFVDSNEPHPFRRGAPVALCVDPGEHNVLVSEDGFHRYEERLSAVAGESLRVRVTLSPMITPLPSEGPQRRRRPWLWAVVGVVVVGGIAAAVAVSLTRDSPAFSDPVWGNKEALRF